MNFKNSTTFVISLFAMGSVYGQSNQQYKCTLIEEPQNASRQLELKSLPVSDLTSKERMAQFEEYIYSDLTNKTPYVASPINEKTWFVCNHFATQLFLRTSSFADLTLFTELEYKTPIRFTHESLPIVHRLPVFKVSMNNAVEGYYHAINAIYLGKDGNGYNDILNYAFLEPQNDRIYDTPTEILNAYFPKTMGATRISMSIPSGVGHVSSGDVQYLSDVVYSFNCTK